MKTLLLLMIISSTVYGNQSPIITADKVKGIISVYYPDTKEVIVAPALFGKVKSNKLNMENYDKPSKFDGITPAGIYPIEKIYSWHLNSDMLVFIKGKSSVAAIHPLWTKNPDQKRVQRLLSETPLDNRITSGCINVDPVFFNQVLVKLPPGTILNVLAE